MDARYAASVEALDRALLETRRFALAPSPSLSFREWAGESVKLSKETSARPGKFRPFIYQQGIMDTMSDPSIRIVSVVKPTQVGYTAILEMFIAYLLEHDPSSVLFYMPTDDDVRRFHDDHFMPLVKNVPALAEILRGDGEWNIRRTTRGSRVSFLSAFNVKNFQSHRARAAIIDEISSDAFDPSGKTKEDKISAAMERTGSFPNRKNILGGTPSVKGHCRIWSWYLRGDQRQFHVPDPGTGEMVTLEFGDRSTPYGLKWKERDADTVVYRFPSGTEVTEREFDREILPHGQWIATAVGEPGHASFRFNALVSPMPGADWPAIVRKWLSAKDEVRENPGSMKAFYNHVLGLPFEDFQASKGRKSTHELRDLQEVWQAPVPGDVNFLTAAVDVQSENDGWFAVKCVGWGYNEASRVIGYWKLVPKAPLSTPEAWEELAAFLRQGFIDENGKTHFFQAVGIDSGGHYTQEVYDFSAKHQGRRWWAIKGKRNVKGRRSDGGQIWPKEASVTDKGRVYMVDVDIAKDILYRRLHGDKAALNSIRFPLDHLPGSVPFDDAYFIGLTKEQKVYVQGGTGYYWSSPSGQEAWDTGVYNLVTLHGLRSLPGGDLFIKLTGKDPQSIRAAAARAANSGAPVKPTPAGKPAPRPASKPRYGLRR
ncbi:MAG: phage terminase large subunit family protein [Paracoccus sp.]|nr:phage terminase large subunit family protein [Paracoccus sp. (in: a-proteobacteria)]